MNLQGFHRFLRSKKTLGLLFVLPATIILFLVYIYPLIYNVDLSLSEWNIAVGGEKYYVGLSNYSYNFSDSLFQKVLKNTIVFTAVSVPLEVVIGLGLALLINRKIRGRSIFLAILCLPMMIASVIVGLTWRWLFAWDYGLLNPLIGVFGIGPVNWLADPSIAMYSVIIADVWCMTPFIMLFCYAGLRMVPQERYEAAEIDGVSAWQKFRHITLPSIKGILVIAILIRAMDAFTKLFDVAYTLTGGGPAYATEVLPIYAYRVGLVFFRLGRGASIAMITLFITILMILIIKKLTKR
jgi:ABC-type sugar transport system permease subunit